MKVILISYYYPPSEIPNARRPYLIARELNACGYIVEVLTQGDVNAGYNSKEIGLCKVTHVVDPIRKWLLSRKVPKITKRVLRRLWPDRELMWTIMIARKLFAEKQKVAVILAINPISNLLLPLLVKNKNIQYIIDYHESVTPYRKMVPFAQTPHRQLIALLEKIEKKALSLTSIAVFTSSRNREAYINCGLCTKNRSVYIPHYSDAITNSGNSIECDKKLLISYYGSFNRDRSPRVFLGGLAIALNRTPEIRNNIRVNVYGNGMDINKIASTTYDVINNCGVIKREDMELTIVHNHVLMLIASPYHDLFFPSKITEYINARRPILAILSSKSETRQLLVDSGRDRWICDYESEREVADCLQDIWDLFKKGLLAECLSEYRPALTDYYTPIWDRIVRNSMEATEV